jgi:hypothetical protein
MACSSACGCETNFIMELKFFLVPGDNRMCSPHTFLIMSSDRDCVAMMYDVVHLEQSEVASRRPLLNIARPYANVHGNDKTLYSLECKNFLLLRLEHKGGDFVARPITTTPKRQRGETSPLDRLTAKTNGCRFRHNVFELPQRNARETRTSN